MRPKVLGMQAGLGLAVEDINQAGGVTGKPLRAAIADTAGDPALAARLAESLITEDCASALVGGFTLEESAAIRQVSERYGVPCRRGNMAKLWRHRRRYVVQNGVQWRLYQ
jgi:branched-chain amino acid transport system substrate-binding protein